MKRILLFTCVVIILTVTTGCLVSDSGPHGHYRGQARFESHTDVIVPAPVIVVPVVRVRVD